MFAGTSLQAKGIVAPAANEGHATADLPAGFGTLLDWFVPPAMRDEVEARRRAHMFLISHVFGPCLGLAVMAYLYALDPAPGPAFWISVSAITVYWIFPLALRLTGCFTALALLSVQNLAFIVLFLSNAYGGGNSPFLPWLVTMPLLAFFYLGENTRLHSLVLGVLCADLGIFYLVHRLTGPYPTRIPPEALSTIGIVSVFCAGIYVTGMALYYTRIVVSRSTLQREILNHKATAISLRDAKEAAEAANRAKTEFVATMSHELRTPLNAIIGFSELMKIEAYGSLGHAKYRGYADDIHNSGNHLLEIINDVLDIAKAEAGKFDLVDSIVDCRDVLLAVSPLIRTRLEKAGLALTMNISDDLPQLRADLRKLKQILINLLSNAVKFTPAGGRVEVSVSADRLRGLILAVRDNGIGIAQEHLSKVLQPFYQVDSSLSRRHAGTGLGLPLVVMMMQQHGGTLRLESELGKGTTAFITFPPERLLWSDARPGERGVATNHADNPASAAGAPAAGLSPLGSRAPAILVVDDDEDARELCRRMLTRAGFTAITAGHGREALHCLQQQNVDLVVTDMLMPEMDGVELMRTLRTARPTLPIIAISGVDEWEEYLGIATNLGAKATLRKPIDAAQLAQTVGQVLDGARHEQETAVAG